MEERREGLREAVGRSTRAVDRYTRQLHQLSLESSEREVRWLNELIAAESAAEPDGPVLEPDTTTVSQHKEGEPDHG